MNENSNMGEVSDTRASLFDYVVKRHPGASVN